MTDHPHATSVGQTGGLPGANADPATAELSADELADTVNSGAPAAEGADGGAVGGSADDAAGAGSNG